MLEDIRKNYEKRKMMAESKRDEYEKEKKRLIIDCKKKSESRSLQIKKVLVIFEKKIFSFFYKGNKSCT